jgi:hypothetical protein
MNSVGGFGKEHEDAGTITGEHTMKKLRQKVRADEPVLIGIAGGTKLAPEPRMTAFLWGDEQDIDLVLTAAKDAA